MISYGFSKTPQAFRAPRHQLERPLEGHHSTAEFKPLVKQLLTPGELMRLLGMGSSNFHLHQKRGAFRHLEVKRPIGIRRYSRALAEAFVSGESTVQLGRGSRRHA